jgi:hypothetical protein
MIKIGVLIEKIKFLVENHHKDTSNLSDGQKYLLKIFVFFTHKVHKYS